ncbi:PREDICTED: uncharacterized protein LOC105460739, partial [Wasmannia auropunctata]|uniref:uncharacterized protein LOC105460739 n=1 Tax=Wasmannia auropunctata TaxID=64793 RepID=UPI0005EE5783
MARLFESYACLHDIGLIVVDIFFFSSGCLVTYLYLQDKTNERSIKPINCRDKLIEFFFYIIKRFIRLTPAYMMALGISQLSSAWLDKTSQFYMNER